MMTRWLFFGLFTLLVAGCARQQVEEPAAPIPVITPLEVAGQLLIPRFNVSVLQFDSAFPVAESGYSAAAQVRSVELRLLPYLLKRTLDRSGFWGAVRVMPTEDPNAELLVRASVIQSDGVLLRLIVTVTDVTGRVWLDQVYEDMATTGDYGRDPSPALEPFQHLYNRIANDMAEVLMSRSIEEIDQVLTVAVLRYAADLSPHFGRYLAEADGRVTVAALPAENDPLLERVLRIREAEALFADSVDEHFESLFRKVGLTYAWWRYYSHELITGNERLAGVDPSRGATRGSWYALERNYKTFRESRMNEDALRELTVSFDRETASTLAEIRGRVVQLHGTLEEQYRKWRELLRAFYAEETGDMTSLRPD